MSKTSFPDIIGPTAVAANGGSDVGIRNKSLNILAGGATAADNPQRRRIDLTILDAEFRTVSASTSSSGEWQPTITDLAPADLVRVSSSVTGTIMTGADDASPIRLTKFFANVGGDTIQLQPPGVVLTGHDYFVNSYTLRPNETVRAVWDVVSKVYRIQSGGFVGVSNYIVLEGNAIVIGGNRILRP